MEALFADGRIVDYVLAIVAIEAFIVLAYRYRTGHGIAFLPFAVNAASGVCLMICLKTALSGGHWTTIAVFLALSGVAHGADLWMRWR